jgi:hypothetical protein
MHRALSLLPRNKKNDTRDTTCALMKLNRVDEKVSVVWTKVRERRK